MVAAFVGQVYEHFEKITDPRLNRGRNYPLLEMIFVALCGAICDCNAWTDVATFGKCKLDWFRKFFPFENGVPSHDTFSEVFARLDTLEFYAALESWAREMAVSLRGETVALDGKTLRGSFDKGTGKSALHSVSAWACGLRMCLALKSVADKSNEIPAVQELIDMLDLQGAVVTADAMHCQTETAEKIVGKKADYVLMVKGNQETLHQELQDALVAAFDEENPRMRTRARARRIATATKPVKSRCCPCPPTGRCFSVGRKFARLAGSTVVARSTGGWKKRRSSSSAVCPARSAPSASICVRTGAPRTRSIMCWM